MQESRGLKGLLMGQLDSRSTDAGTRVLATAQSLKKIADELKSDELSRGTASLAVRGADSLERVGNYLKDADGNRLLTDAERFGRSRPWAVAMTGFALGLAGSRMLKASASRRHLSDTDEFGYAGAGFKADAGGSSRSFGYSPAPSTADFGAAPQFGKTSKPGNATKVAYGDDDGLDSADRELL